MKIEDIKFNYKIANKQNDLFTTSHEKYKCILKYKRKQYTFEYQCNPKYSKPTLLHCLVCLMNDAYTYIDNIYEFANEYGYDVEEYIDFGKKSKLYKAYSGCRKAYKNLNRLFNEEEIEDLCVYLNERGY